MLEKRPGEVLRSESSPPCKEIPLAPVSAIVGMKWSDAQENSTSKPAFACTSREELCLASERHAPFWGKKETLFKKGS